MLLTTHYKFGERGALALGHRGIQQMIGFGRSGPASKQVSAREVNRIDFGNRDKLYYLDLMACA
jgi:hypothetical protein